MPVGNNSTIAKPGSRSRASDLFVQLFFASGEPWSFAADPLNVLDIVPRNFELGGRFFSVWCTDANYDKINVETCSMMTPEMLHKRIDPDLRAAFRFFVTAIGADEGSLWILDPDGRKLRIAFNSGSRYSELELAIATSIDGSQVGRCFKEEQVVRDTSTFGGPERDLSIDKALHQRTFYQISVPFRMGDKLLGVLSVVQDQSAKKSIEWGFQSDDVDKTLTTAKILARLLS